jgi:hypothetical protein
VIAQGAELSIRLPTPRTSATAPSDEVALHAWCRRGDVVRVGEHAVQHVSELVQQRLQLVRGSVPGG